jgi:DUF1680 family protein
MKNIYSISEKIFLIIIFFFIINDPIFGQNETNRDIIKPKIPFKVIPFSLKDVRLLDGPFKEALELNHKYLLDLDIDRLLHNFRINSGLPSACLPLGGWEAPDVELRGHFIGHFLSACAIMYSSTGDERLVLKADSVVEELGKCQNALGKSGYLSAYPESFIERVETGKPVWAPWYTLHKIFTGFIDIYLHMNNKDALLIAEKMAMWVKSRTDHLTEEQIQKMLKVEFGGMNEMFYNLYALTGKTDYMELGKRFEHKSFFVPLANHQDKLKGLHVNTQIPKIIGAARAFELTGIDYYKKISLFFWKQVVNARAYATGGTSNYEYWRAEPYHLSDQLSSNDHENCCTYNMLKLTSKIFKWDPTPELGDYYERALFNGILGTQHPKEGGAFMYYVPMRSGLFRYFCEPETSFVCCSGTGIESNAKFGDNIYFHNETQLYVNQFIASELNWKEKNLHIIQQTKFPEEEGTTLIIQPEKPVSFSIKIRIPYWAVKGIIIKINGKELEGRFSSGSFLTITREWKNEDQIEISFPMSLHLHKMPDNPKRVCIMYGPLVLAGALGAKEMSEDMKYGMRGDAYRMNTEGAAIEAPKFITDSEDPENWLKPVKDKPLTFKTIHVGKPEDVILIPFNKIFGERYAIYWDLFTSEEWTKRSKKYEKTSEIIDKFDIGDEIDEYEHDFQAYYLQKGDTNGKKWVKSKSWFRFDVNILPEKPIIFRASYFGNESNALFGLYIDGIEFKITPIPEHSDGFYYLDYELPFELTKGKERICISYKALDKNKFVSVVDTNAKKEPMRFETPKCFGCEIKEKK